MQPGRKSELLVFLGLLLILRCFQNEFDLLGDFHDLPHIEALLVIDRMAKDWDKLAPSMRKGWNFREASQLHSACGGYLYFMGLLKEKVPEAEYEQVAHSLKDQFLCGFLDPDIHHALTTTAPPAPLEAVSFLRQALRTEAFTCS